MQVQRLASYFLGLGGLLYAAGVCAWEMEVSASAPLSSTNHWLCLLLGMLLLLLFSALFFWAGKQVQRRKASERLLDSRTELISSMLNALPEIIFYKDNEGIYRHGNTRFSDFMGGRVEDLLGKTDFEIFDHETSRFFRQMDREAIEAGRSKVNEEWVEGGDGNHRLMETHKSPLFDHNGDCIGVLGYCRDITLQRQSEENLQHIAYHDPLTNLPNRLRLAERLDYALQLSKRDSELLAVIFLDLDRFKHINDTLGHAIGDVLLKDVAQRLRESVRESDICARLGGDEFVVVLTQMNSRVEIEKKCQQLLETIAKPYQLQSHQVTVFTSAGISYFPDHAATPDQLIRDADSALQAAKGEGRNRYYVFREELSQNQHSYRSLEQDLRLAFDRGEFSLVYQPQFRLGENHPRRIEALVRWSHPQRGNISPHDFIPIAETSGLMTELGLWVIETACLQFLSWKKQGVPLDRVAVNVSAMQFSAQFADQIIALLQRLEFDPQWLELEVTESLMMSVTTEVSQQLQRLHQIGIEFAIDDFGTGYSSLSKIKALPLNVLKIDQSFVRDINDDVSDYEIARAIILMAKSLGLTVIAEGVENREQEQTLKRLGCEWVQGFYYSAPMDASRFFRRYCQ
ncbi:putative bifunctional diguanylate cyclase/phosphodiesterase [Bacterioplanoides sp.]|uniref:putative bifunctional diguanylate cyclase/phosphodiesterase n=1 Tax=Bacterioplanoides sp. TaxID=2066072 RepID=UPI003B007EA6